MIEATIASVDDAPYDRLTLDDIAERAGTTAVLIRRWWPTKAHLLLDAFLHHSSRLDTPDTGALRSDLEALTVQNAQLFTRRRDRNLTIAALAACAELGLDHTGIHQPRRNAVAAIFQRAAARGELPDGVDPALTSQLLGGAVLFRAMILNEDTDDVTVRRLVETVLPRTDGVPPVRSAAAVGDQPPQ